MLNAMHISRSAIGGEGWASTAGIAKRCSTAGISDSELNDGGSDRDCRVVLREVLTTNRHRIEGVGAIRASFEAVFLRLSQLLTTLILLAVVHAGSLNRGEKFLIVLDVEHWNQMGTAIKHTIDEQMLQHVVHWLADVHTRNQPSIGSEGIEDDGLKGNVVHGITTLFCRGIKIKDHSFILMMSIILAEVIYQLDKFPFILDKETFKFKYMTKI